MKKIISLFQRNYSGNRLIRNEIVPGAEWVVAGEGVATRKFDGTCCMVRGGKLFKRYDAKKGRTPPHGFGPVQEPDRVTGRQPGWISVGDGPEDKWFMEAWNRTGDPDRATGVDCGLPDGTYELCGPKVQGNPEGCAVHFLIPHGIEQLPDCPRDFEGLRQYLMGGRIEGVVWHHPDGRMAKIKGKDFGIRRKNDPT